MNSPPLAAGNFEYKISTLTYLNFHFLFNNVRPSLHNRALSTEHSTRPSILVPCFFRHRHFNFFESTPQHAFLPLSFFIANMSRYDRRAPPGGYPPDSDTSTVPFYSARSSQPRNQTNNQPSRSIRAHELLGNPVNELLGTPLGELPGSPAPVHELEGDSTSRGNYTTYRQQSQVPSTAPMSIPSTGPPSDSDDELTPRASFSTARAISSHNRYVPDQQRGRPAAQSGTRPHTNSSSGSAASSRHSQLRQPFTNAPSRAIMDPLEAEARETQAAWSSEPADRVTRNRDRSAAGSPRQARTRGTASYNQSSRS